MTSSRNQSGASDNGDLDALLEYIRESHAFDSGAYKRASLTRRINARMAAAGVEDYRSYVDLLQADTKEYPRLFDTILINVTSFFRDPAAWKLLAERAIPGILSEKTGDDPVRVWSAGCSSGEEAYTLAMVLAEHMGLDGAARRLKIYATDIDDAALETGRSGRYTAKDIKEVPASVSEKYFSVSDLQHPRPYVFDKRLRRTIIFGHHDLLSDPPISRLDLVVCRNTLMYFNIENQRQILRRFHFALNGENSVLFLGKAESLMTGSTLFQPIDSKTRIFRKIGQTNGHQAAETMERRKAAGGRSGRVLGGSLRSAIFDVGETAQLVVDRSGVLILASARAREMFRLEPGDVGRLFSDLTASYTPIEFRSLVDEVRDSLRPVKRGPLQWPSRSDRELWAYITVTPLIGSNGAYLGAKLEIDDVTQLHQATEELRKAQEDIETFQEELQSSNEELEAANEELQSTIEELETTNEELQSTNEELETTNEELRSTNENLNAANVQLVHWGEEADRANRFLSEVAAGLADALVVIGPDLEVLIWSDGAAELWGVTDKEAVGTQFFELDIGLPVGELRPAVERCRSEGEAQEEVIQDAVDRRGKPLTIRTIVCPVKTGGLDGDVMVAINLVGD